MDVPTIRGGARADPVGNSASRHWGEDACIATVWRRVRPANRLIGALARRFRADRHGTVAILGGFTLLALVLVGATAMDIANLYFVQAKDQRIADQSALAAAFAYGQSTNSASTAQNAAASLATANGAGSATVVTTIVNSPSGDGMKAAMVVVTSPVSLSPFGQVASKSTLHPTGLLTTSVGATAYAEIHAGAPCVIALGSGGITASGGLSLAATACNVGSTGSLNAQGGAVISGLSVYTAGTVTTSNGGVVKSVPTAGQVYQNSSAQTDPFATAGIFSRLPTVAAMNSPILPSVGSAPTGGSTMTCSSGTLAVSSGIHGGITASSSCATINFAGGAETDVSGGGLSVTSSNTTVNFAAGTYKINGIYLGGSSTATFNATGAPVFDVWNGINLQSGTSATLTVNGPATYNVQGGISNYSSKALTFTNSGGGSISTFNVAGGIVQSGGSSSYPDGNYAITSSNGDGIAVNNASSLTFGNGTFNISGADGGISVASSGSLTIGSQINTGSDFQIDFPSGGTGNAISTGGSSSITLGSFTNFDIDGPVSFSGNVSLGAGSYAINGAFSACPSGGGSITGTSVSIVVSGAICFGNGYNSIALTAPTAIDNATDGTAATVVLATNSTSGATVTGGTSSTSVVGAVYLPNAALTANNAANLSGNGACLQVIAQSISLSGAASISTNCPNLGNTASPGSVALVQ